MWAVLIPTSYRKRFQLNHQNKSIRKLRRLRRISLYSLQTKNSRPLTSSPECCHISIGKGSYLNRNMWPELIGSMICGCNKAVCHVCQRKVGVEEFQSEDGCHLMSSSSSVHTKCGTFPTWFFYFTRRVFSI